MDALWEKGGLSVLVCVISDNRQKNMEKVYKTMKSVGAFNVVVGILMIVSGIAFGIVVIAKGAKLLKSKSDIMF